VDQSSQKNQKAKASQFVTNLG